MLRKCLSHLLCHRQGRIERGLRLLEYHGDTPAPEAAHLLLWQGQEVYAVEHYGAADFRRPRQQPGDTQRSHGFAAARLPQQREGFPLLNPEIHPVNGLDRVVFSGKPNF